jgi:hypothetical protein
VGYDSTADDTALAVAYRLPRLNAIQNARAAKLLWLLYPYAPAEHWLLRSGWCRALPT